MREVCCGGWVDFVFVLAGEWVWTSTFDSDAKSGSGVESRDRELRSLRPSKTNARQWSSGSGTAGIKGADGLVFGFVGITARAGGNATVAGRVGAGFFPSWGLSRLVDCSGSSVFTRSMLPVSRARGSDLTLCNSVGGCRFGIP